MIQEKRTYMDYAASTPIAPEVRDAMEPFLSERFANPNALHTEGRAARTGIERAREQAAAFIGARSDEIVFVSGGTEANNLALFGVVLGLERDGQPIEEMRLVTTAIEHSSVKDVFVELERRDATVVTVGVDGEGRTNERELIRAAEDATLVSIMYANNEIGTLQPVADVGHAIAKRQHTSDDAVSFLHCDVGQAPLFSRIDVGALTVDLLSLDAQKLYGPKGVGALFVKRGTPLEPHVRGGRQERGRRGGTQNVPAIVGFGEACMLAEERREEDKQRLEKLRDFFIAEVRSRILQAILNGAEGEARLANNINFSFPQIPSELLVIKLDEAGIAASSKSACLPAGEGSPVVAAIDPSRADTAVRFSLGRETTRADVQCVVQVLAEILS